MSSKRFSVGITGGIGSGKTTVANMFATRGVPIIDTDQIAHQLTASGGAAIPEIRKQFGPTFLTSEGALNRARMSDFIFQDVAEKIRLESILHPLIWNETEQTAAKVNNPYLIFVVPLLVENSSWQQRVNRVLVIDCPEDLQVKRVMQRSKLKESQVQAIMAAQVPRHVRLAAAHDVILNQEKPSMLEPQVEKLHNLYMHLAILKDK